MKTKCRPVLEWVWFFLIVGIGWQLLAILVNNALICPSPVTVLWHMKEQFVSPDFWPVILQTILRAMLALLLSFAAAVPCAFLAAFYPLCSGFLNRLVSVLQTVPNVCYIILLLFWTSRVQTVILTGFFLLFPLIYRTLYEQLCAIQKDWKDVWILYPQPRWVLMIKICLPLLQPALLAALKNASSLSFKACVTSEILTGLSFGIGRKIQSARFDLNLAGVAGWSLWLVLLVFLFEKLISWLIGAWLKR